MEMDGDAKDRETEGGDPKQSRLTMNLVLTTHSGLVMTVPVAPAVIAAITCNNAVSAAG